jgi:hypothetical protein
MLIEEPRQRFAWIVHTMGAVVEALVHGARPPVTIETIPEEAALAQASIAVYVLQMGLPAKFFNKQICPLPALFSEDAGTQFIVFVPG